MPPFDTLKGEERVSAAKVGEEAVVKAWPVSKANSVFPMPLAVIETVLTERDKGELKVKALSLLLKVVQSAEDSLPVFEADATGRLKV